MAMLHTFKIILFEVQLSLGTVDLMLTYWVEISRQKQEELDVLPVKKVLVKRQLPKYRGTTHYSPTKS